MIHDVVDLDAVVQSTLDFVLDIPGHYIFIPFIKHFRVLSPLSGDHLKSLVLVVVRYTVRMQCPCVKSPFFFNMGYFLTPICKSE